MDSWEICLQFQAPFYSVIPISACCIFVPAEKTLMKKLFQSMILLFQYCIYAEDSKIPQEWEMRNRTAVNDSRSGTRLQQKRQKNMWGPNQSVSQEKSKCTFSGWPLCSSTSVVWTNILHVNSSKLQNWWTRHPIFLEPHQRNKGLTFKRLRLN